MLLAGDEFGRTQQGNNNAYCQDNEISWVDWNIGEDGAALIDFVRRLIALRQAFPDPAPLALPHRRIQRGARREGRALADAGGDRHRGRAMAGRAMRAASAC